jgi:hypothetical protein
LIARVRVIRYKHLRNRRHRISRGTETAPSLDLAGLAIAAWMGFEIKPGRQIACITFLGRCC